MAFRTASQLPVLTMHNIIAIHTDAPSVSETSLKWKVASKLVYMATSVDIIAVFTCWYCPRVVLLSQCYLHAPDDAIYCYG